MSSVEIILLDRVDFIRIPTVADTLFSLAGRMLSENELDADSYLSSLKVKDRILIGFHSFCTGRTWRDVFPTESIFSLPSGIVLKASYPPVAAVLTVMVSLPIFNSNRLGS